MAPHRHVRGPLPIHTPPIASNDSTNPAARLNHITGEGARPPPDSNAMCRVRP